MTRRALIPAVALLAVLAACENKPAEAPKATSQAKVTPLPPAAPAAPAASAGQDAAPAAQTAAVADTKQAQPKGCQAGKCKIAVDVGANCAITVTPDVLGVFRDNKGDTITWKIATPGWQFAPDGIAFKQANTQFTDKNPSAQVYTWKDANTDTATYPYTVNVVNGAQKCSKDPSIVNGVLVPDTV